MTFGDAAVSRFMTGRPTPAHFFAARYASVRRVREPANRAFCNKNAIQILNYTVISIKREFATLFGMARYLVLICEPSESRFR